MSVDETFGYVLKEVMGVVLIFLSLWLCSLVVILTLSDFRENRHLKTI